MNETIITLAGWIASDPRLHDTTGGPVLNFRLGATPRRYNKRTNEWYDGETQWHRVNVWRGLAENAHRSQQREEGDDQSEERPAPEWQTAAVAEESAA